MMRFGLRSRNLSSLEEENSDSALPHFILHYSIQGQSLWKRRMGSTEI